LAAPLTAAAPAAVLADHGLKSRLARLEDEAAIHKLHQNWLRQINGTEAPVVAALKGVAPHEALRNLAPDHVDEPDAINIASDGKSATGRFHCVVEIETAIPQDCTLAQMAHAQGDGFVRRTEHRILNVEYVKMPGCWSIASAQVASA
jgi:hypothetical protein